MDKFEKLVIGFSVAMMTVFVFFILLAAGTKDISVADCLPYDARYLEPGVVELNDSTFQIKYVASMWQFEPNEVAIPVGSEVDMYLTSKDVVHGFQIHEKNINLMAVYGSVTKATTRFTEPGVYKIICHEYCGTGHQMMAAEIIVYED
jgi:cytochrome c oxidase subunit II